MDISTLFVLIVLIAGIALGIMSNQFIQDKNIVFKIQQKDSNKQPNDDILRTEQCSLERACSDKSSVTMYVPIIGDVSFKKTHLVDKSEQAYRLFCEDIRKCELFHQLIFQEFESNRIKKAPFENNILFLKMFTQEIDIVLAFLHDIYDNDTTTSRFKYISIDRFKYENFSSYLTLKTFYHWLLNTVEEVNTKSTKKEINDGVTNVKRRRTRASNSNTKESTNSQQKDI